MSFPKARLLRFNEEMTCAPPPGKYDPKLDTKVKGAVIEKSKRFVDPKIDPAPSIETSDSISTCSQPTFRTPQLYKKKVVCTPRSNIESRTKRAPVSEPKTKKKLDDIFKFEKEKNLVDQINELERVHSNQLIDKDQEISCLYTEMTELKNSMDKLELSHSETIASMKNKYEKEITELVAKLDKSNQELNKEKDDHAKVVNNLKSQLHMLEQNLKNSTALNNELEFQLSDSQLNFIEMKNKYDLLETELKATKENLMKIVKEKELEIKKLEQREDVEGVTELKKNCASLEQKLKEAEENWILNWEIERMEMCNQFEVIATNLHEKISSYEKESLHFFEAMNTMTDEFDTKAKELMDSINFNKLNELENLTEELEQQKAENLEHKILIVDLQEKIEILELEMSKTKNQNRKLEIVHKEATKTIQVLSKRLYESETEVEKLNDIRDELNLRRKALEEKVQVVVNENHDLKIKMREAESSIVKEVMDVEKKLIAQVDNYKKAAYEENLKMKTIINEKQECVESLLNEIDLYREKLNELQEFKTIYESVIDEHKNEIQNLSIKFTDIEEKFDSKLESEKLKFSKLKNKFDLLKTATENCKEVIAQLETAKNQLEQQLEQNIEQLKNSQLNQEILKNKLSEAEIKIETIDIENFEHEKHIDDLNLKLDHYTKCGIDSALKIGVLSNKVSEKDKEINVLKKEIEEKNNQIDEINKELEESKVSTQTMTDHVVSLINELADKERIGESLMHELDVRNGNMMQISEDYETIKKLYEQEVSKNEALEKDMHETLKDNEKYMDEMISELVLEKERCSELLQNIEVLNQKIESLEENVQKLTTDLNLNLEKQEEFAKKIGLLEQNEFRLNDENFRLHNEYNALEKINKDLSEHNEDLINKKSSLESKINELTAEKDDLVEMVKRQWEEMELLTNEISNQQEIIDELKNSKSEDYKAMCEADLQNEILVLQQTLDDAQNAVMKMKAKEEDLIFKLQGAEAELNNAETVKENLEARVKELNEKNDELDGYLAAMEKRKNEYKMYAAELEIENQTLKEQIVNLTEEKERLTEENHEGSMKCTSLNAQVTDLECRNKELENIIGPFKEQLLQFESERSRLLSKTENTEKELKALAIEHAKSLGHQNHKQKIKYVVQLTENMSDLKKEMEKLRNENNKLRATILEHSKESSLKRSNSIRGKRENNKENNGDTSPLVNKKSERQSSPANALKQRNAT